MIYYPQKEEGSPMRPDQDTFVELQFRKYYPSLMQAAVKILKNTSLAQDLVQDTFLALIDAIDEVRDHPDIKGWLHRALLNRLKWYFRDQKRYNALFLSMSSDFPIEPGEEDKGLDAVGLNWSRDLAEVRQGLSKEEFYIFKRQALDKASYLELAQELGVSVYALKKRRERLIKKLHKLYPHILNNLE